eukprot:TRINITY_DN4182_c0_g2_i2.p1 TRINITY_DN4182_c0_g2~~TRINITY_DN4182_c0_g2_i2.p1  ORF type:complete len:125 (-),score=30.51 TRINITY_DN4182_c0_g2_i2:95-469(-)
MVFVIFRQEPSLKVDMASSLYVTDLITPPSDSVLRQNASAVVKPEAQEFTSGEKLRESMQKHARYVNSPPDKFAQPVLSSQEVGWRSAEGSASVAQHHRQGTQITHFQESMITLTKGGNAFLRK